MIGESQRQAYLRAIGVVQYVPRVPLPGALSSLNLEALAAASDIAPPSEIPAQDIPAQDISVAGISAQVIPAAEPKSAPAEGAGPRRIDELLDFQPASKKPAGKAETASQPAIGQEKAGRTVPRFALSVSVLGPFMIVDDAVDAHEQLPGYQQLLENIFFALGFSWRLDSSERFQWPMVKSAQVDQGEAAAGQALQAFLNRQLEQRGCRVLLLLGERAARFSGCAELVAVQRHTDTVFAPPVYRLPSAAALLTQPQQKAPFWRQLQGLRELLHEDSSC